MNSLNSLNTREFFENPSLSKFSALNIQQHNIQETLRSLDRIIFLKQGRESSLFRLRF